MVTLKDIAKKAGVNTSTVSRALSGDSDISEITREKIRKIADELNYRPNQTARILAGKGSKMIGIIVPEIDSNYFAKLIYSVEKQLQVNGYFLVIANTQYDLKKEAAIIETFCNYNVDGIFLASSIHVENQEALRHVNSALNIPIVLLEALNHHVDYSYVMIDDTYGMSEAIAHLLKKGHKKIGFISDYIIDKIRVPMFKEALRRNNLMLKDNPIISHPNARFEKAGYDVMTRFLQMDNYPTAYLAGYDDIAIGAMRAATEKGLRVPEDIAFIGNDNIRESAYLYKTLTTLAPPVDKMAELGVKLLINNIENKNNDVIHQVSLKPRLLIRETT